MHNLAYIYCIYLANGRLLNDFSISKLKHLFQAGNIGVDLVFVAACNSEFVGQAFVEAGVKHVIAIKYNYSLSLSISLCLCLIGM